MIPFRNLAETRTPDGSRFSLHEHDGDYFLKLNGRQLMGSNLTTSEIMLADLACGYFQSPDRPRILIGGLGLGFSLCRVLEIAGPTAVVVVAELLPEVVAWNREFLTELNGKLLDDPGGRHRNFLHWFAVENPLTTAQSLRLQSYRAWLHTIRHIGEAVGGLAVSREVLPCGAEACASGLMAWVTQNIALGAEATATMDAEKIRVFFESSKQKDPAVREMRRNFLGNCGTFSSSGTLDMSSMVDDFDIAAWLIHRLSKLQMQSMESSV